jgi:hypothetical protein
MDNKRNSTETTLIGRIEKAIEKYKKPDERAGGDFYFEPEAVREFQNVAMEIIILIGDQGAKNTSEKILSVADEVKKLTDLEWNHADSIGRAFECGIGVAAPLEKKRNPFSRLKLPPFLKK